MTAPTRTTGAVVLATLRRFVLLLVAVAGGTAAVSLLLGLLLGAGVGRSVSLGFYLVGSFLLIAGFFVGNRGPARVKGGDPGWSFFGISRNRRLRWATAEEQVEALSLSFIFVALGLVLIVLGAATDTRYALV